MYFLRETDPQPPTVYYCLDLIKGNKTKFRDLRSKS